MRLPRPGLYRLTPRTGSGRATASAAALYVRAVRKASSVRTGSGGGSSAGGGAPTTTAGGTSAGGIAAGA